MFRSYYTYLILAIILCGCKQNVNVTQPIKDSSSIPVRGTTGIQYSELLSITDDGPYTLCCIKDPWRTDEVVRQYLLVPSTDSSWDDNKVKDYNDRYGASIVLRTPLKRNSLTSSCHAWLLSQLDALDLVAVMCDTAYVTASNLRYWMRQVDANGLPVVADGGNSMMPNREVILSQSSDAIWINPFENSSSGNLSQLPIPIIYCADYLETTPLGRAEWMKFYGRLVGKGTEADLLFEQVASRYENLIKENSNGQKILAEMPYGATWYVAGGCSSAAMLYQDAGYIYPWSDDNHAGSLSLSKESVLVKAQDCDVWLIKYIDNNQDWTLDKFLSQDKLYSQFKAAKEGNVWGCNTAHSDFFDVTPFRPDSLLQSLQQHDGAFFKLLK